MAWYDLFTDSLVRYLWLEKWYGDTVGIVEYLSEWVRDYTTTDDAKVVGICFVIVMCLTIVVRGVEFMKKPREGDSIWKQLLNKEEDS